jgi:hypothetical protein
MVFRNDFKDLVDTVPLPFKPITIKHVFNSIFYRLNFIYQILHNESIYTVVFGEALTAGKLILFVLTIQPF